ncbi:MAG: hypothetical protein NWE88_07015 [Candidatus Bathyarchaeota archaeon]|nr:hypothetical protein [Candidatus Bathyarchaeota archaeon]
MTNIEPYTNKTWVAFVDISGFKNEMRKGKRQARKMLNKFHNSIFNNGLLFTNRNPDWNTIELNLLSVSDCAILFTRNQNRTSLEISKGLATMLLFIKNMNRELIRPPKPRILTTSSICYGEFNIEPRTEGSGINKEFFYGDGYVDAYRDNSSQSNKIQPGECRIKIDENINIDFEDNVFRLLNRERRYYMYYWMLDNPIDISKFKQVYNINIYELKKDILNGYIDQL